MDLSLSEEQQLLKESVARFVQDHGGMEQRRRLRASPEGFDRATWQAFAELGWLALPFSSEYGGLDGSPIDVMVLMEQFGRGLVAEPYLVNVVICGGLLAAGSPAQAERHIPPLLGGETQWALGFAENGSRYDLANIATTARRDGDAFVLHGHKVAALNAHVADHLIITARTADNEGISLFIVDASAEGVSREPLALIDGTRGAHLRFEDVRVGADALLGQAGGGLEALETVIAQAGVAMGAEALGAMEALLEQTVDYAKTRVQFGQPIGSFQALQHRMADMYLHCQNLRSLLYYAAITLSEGRPDARRAASALKVKLGESGRFVSQQAVQLHGGIGMTDELAISHYFKRLMLLSTLFGDAEHHLDRYMDLAEGF